MAKRSIPAPTQRSMTPEEKEKCAQDLLAALKKKMGGRRSLIQDEIEADFLQKVRKGMVGMSISTTSKAPASTSEKDADFAAVDGEMLLQVKPGTDSRARLQLALGLLGSASLVFNDSNDAAEDLPWPRAELVAHAVSTAEALLRAELSRAPRAAS